MKINAYLFVDQWGGLRLTKKDNGVKPTELALHLVIDIPDSFFQRPIPQVNIAVPNFFAEPDMKVVASVIAPEVATAMQLDVVAVRDGLLALVEDQDKIAPNTTD